VRRVLLGFLLCTFAYPAFILAAGRPGAFGGAIIIGAFTFGGSIVIGLPVFLAMRRRGWLSAWHFLVGGAGIGAITALPFIAGGVETYVPVAGAFAGLGAVHALAFWVLAVARNPALSPSASAQGSASANA